jgi:hypothetical protein
MRLREHSQWPACCGNKRLNHRPLLAEGRSGVQIKGREAVALAFVVSMVT